MGLAAGEKLGPYEILSQLGEGGMGEVYRARDTRLNRSVAVKVISLSTSDDDRLRRFEQEARSIAALSHPNILAIFDVGTHDNAPYLVTELLEGETLRERLAKGPLPVRKTVQIGSQIAHALAAAHERRIVHRDLKPENIFVTRDGQTKLLDFGLAKMETAGFAAGPDSATKLSAATRPGVVMGTVGYMSPEQVRGDIADHRSDIFSFGAVLYEMLGGKRAFAGDSSVETMTAILKAEPPEISPEAKIPPGLDRIVRHCLEKNPDDRFQSARDLTFALGALSGSESTAALSAVRPQFRDRRLLWLLAGVAVLAVAAAGFFASRPKVAAERMEFSIPVPGEVSHLALSADGSMLAYVMPDEDSGEGILYVQHVGSPIAARLQGTEGAIYPFWSPDNAYVAFFAGTKMKKIPVSGGTPQVLASVLAARGGSWGKKNVIIYAPDAGGPLWRVDTDGTAAAPLTGSFKQASESSHRWPVFLPDGEHFVFWVGDFKERPDDPTTGVYLSSLAAKEKKLLALARSNPGYAQGQLFYVDDKFALEAVAIDVANAKTIGRPRRIADQVGRNPSTYWGAFTVAENGTTVFHLGNGSPLSRLTWVDRSGTVLGSIGESGNLSNPILSPDGGRITVDVADPRGKNIDVWTFDLQRGTSARFTFDPAEETTGVWSRDGKTIAFRSTADGNILHIKNANGLEKDRGLLSALANVYDVLPNSWTLDDSQILCTAQLLTSGGSELLLVSVKDGKVTELLPGNGSKRNGQISPDGKWVAYEADDSGNWEVYISPFPATGGKLQVSRGGGKEPRWRADGKEIFYMDPKGTVLATTVTVEAALATGTPIPLFAAHGRPYISSTDFFTYDVTSDGKRFLVNREQKPAQTPPLNIILNATSESK